MGEDRKWHVIPTEKCSLACKPSGFLVWYLDGRVPRPITYRYRVVSVLSIDDATATSFSLRQEEERALGVGGLQGPLVWWAFLVFEKGAIAVGGR